MIKRIFGEPVSGKEAFARFQSDKSLSPVQLVASVIVALSFPVFMASVVISPRSPTFNRSFAIIEAFGLGLLASILKTKFTNLTLRNSKHAMGGVVKMELAQAFFYATVASAALKIICGSRFEYARHVGLCVGSICVLDTALRYYGASYKKHGLDDID